MTAEQTIKSRLDGHFFVLDVCPQTGVAKVADRRVPRGWLPVYLTRGAEPDYNLEQKAVAEERRAALAPRVAALLAAGYDREQVAKKMGISGTLVTRILKEHGA